jgi:opacity protein-like surface antigen
MKKWLITITALLLFTLPRSTEAYVGAGLGLVDEEEFGYGLLFGVGLPLDFSIDAQLVGFTDSGTTDRYWLQGNVDLAYDLKKIIGAALESIELHPYVKGGFSYAGLVIDTATIDSEASHGPGFNLGAGVDWKVLPMVAIGLDLTHAILFLDGISVGGVQLVGDETAHVFNVLATVKFFAY